MATWDNTRASGFSFSSYSWPPLLAPTVSIIVLLPEPWWNRPRSSRRCNKIRKVAMKMNPRPTERWASSSLSRYHQLSTVLLDPFWRRDLIWHPENSPPRRPAIYLVRPARLYIKTQVFFEIFKYIEHAYIYTHDAFWMPNEALAVNGQIASSSSFFFFLFLKYRSGRKEIRSFLCTTLCFRCGTAAECLRCALLILFFAVVCIPDRLIGSCSRCATHSRPDRTSSLRDPPTSLSSFFYDALSTFFF